MLFSPSLRRHRLSSFVVTDANQQVLPPDDQTLGGSGAVRYGVVPRLAFGVGAVATVAARSIGTTLPE